MTITTLLTELKEAKAEVAKLRAEREQLALAVSEAGARLLELAKKNTAELEHSQATIERYTEAWERPHLRRRATDSASPTRCVMEIRAIRPFSPRSSGMP
jgi:chromosome segregation ATPase